MKRDMWRGRFQLWGVEADTESSRWLRKSGREYGVYLITGKPHLEYLLHHFKQRLNASIGDLLKPGRLFN